MTTTNSARWCYHFNIYGTHAANGSCCQLPQQPTTTEGKDNFKDGLPQVREAIFTVLDSGDPERGGDPWELNARTEHGPLGTALFTVTAEDATENRWRLVEAITGILVGKAQDAVNAELREGKQ